MPTFISILMFSLASLFTGPSRAAETTGDDTLLKDLTAVIMLMGMPCESVVSVKRLAENDHIASCSNGRSYRVFVNEEGRVVVDQQ